MARLVARQRDGDVIEPCGPGERHLQRWPWPVGDGVAHLGERDVELGRGAQANPVGLGRSGGGERDDERGEQDSAHACKE